MKINIAMELVLKIIIKIRKLEVTPLIAYKLSNISVENEAAWVSNQKC